tara:strand:- start:191 stop:856 length:666 start_codon:yes stop_codon:yes gene_type:complete
MIKSIKELEVILGHNFKNKDLLHKALTHKSFSNNINNEKLEFLGDRVLGLIISNILINKYPEESEGVIDKKFANLVNKKTCADIAKKLSLKKYLYLGPSHKNLERSTDKIVSDCLEAIVGAIYLDAGLKISEKFILNCWETYIDKSIITLVDPKTKLQEYTLKKFKKLPKYTFFKKSGPQHKPIFKTEVEIPDSKKIMGVGTSKKNAQQNAAAKLLRILNL